MTYSMRLRLSGLFIASIVTINLIATPVRAQPTYDEQSAIDLRHDGLIRPDENSVVSSNKHLLPSADTVALAPPEMAEQTWFSSVKDTLMKKMKTIRLINPVYVPVAVIKSTPVSNEKEIGFITSQLPDAKQITSYVSQVIMENKKGYALNFDGGELLNFNLSSLTKSVSPNTREPNKKKAFLRVEGKILLPSDIRKHIIEHSINRTGYEEANHIFFKDNHLILDVKEVTGNNQAKVDYQLNQAIESINKQIKSH